MKSKELITDIKSQLEHVIQEASVAAHNYSTDTQSRLAFEVGYLNGRIKAVLGMIEEYYSRSQGRPPWE